MIEAFALPTITAKPSVNGAITVTNVTAADRARVQADFIDADNNLRLGGLKTSDTIVKTLRKNYCALKNVTPSEGFTLSELQDLTLCQLSAAPDDLLGANNDFQSAGVTTCATFNFTACDGAGDTTP